MQLALSGGLVPNLTLAVLGAVLALSPLPALADGRAPLSTLVKFEDRTYRLSYADWVDTETTSVAQVKKIGFGRVSTVDIATSSTGTYSSEGLVSRHIRYPGIDVERVADETALPGLKVWNGMFWQFAGAPSTTVISRPDRGTTVVNRVMNGVTSGCVVSRSVISCY